MPLRLFPPLSTTLVLLVTVAAIAPAQKQSNVIRRDIFVPVQSTAPAMRGSEAKIYVREVALAGATPSRGVVLFIHGAGTPAEVAFDVPYEDYSWMGYLARAGFDVFSADMTGYGRSTRPPAMDDPCNLPTSQQMQFVPKEIPKVCAPSFPTAMTTMSSDWDDIGAVVDHLRMLRNVQTVSLIGWSQGGPRAAGYAAQHPDRVSRLIMLAPAYSRNGRLTAPPEPVAFPNGSMTVQTREDFVTNWDRQVGCPNQYDPAVSASVWSEMLASDPVAARWMPPARRAPQVPTWGFNRTVVENMTTPFLMVSGADDKQVPQANVGELYDDLGSTNKVFIDLACSSHNAMWEMNHLLLFQASREWLTSGTVDGASHGMFKRGY